MKKRSMRIAALFAALALFMTDLTGLAGIGPMIREYWAGKTLQAEAAGAYSFLIGNAVINDGGEINYSNYKNGQRTLSIILKSEEGIASGTAITWTPSNDNIVQIESQNDDECSVTLKILSPGYSGLSVSLKIDGVVYAAVAYCAIHVPLEWSDTETDGNSNILATSANPYGLMVAQMGEQINNYTLQLYTGNSADHPNSWHYLRKLRYVNYEFEAGAAANYAIGGTPPTFVPSNIEEEDLQIPETALVWESSDTSVVEVNAATGLIRAVSAGFARVTVSTSTVNEKLGTNDSLTFNVVVVPEAIVTGYTTDYLTKFSVTVDPAQDDIVIQSNARFASALDWRLYQGDSAVPNREITSDFASKMEIGESTGRVVLSNLPAGVYYLTAIDVKDQTAARLLATYDVIQANIQSLGIVIIVPLQFPQNDLILNYYNDNVYDSYDLMKNSNLPANTFRFTSSDITTARVGANDGVIEAAGLGNCNIVIRKISNQAIENIFGSYAASGAAINFDGTDYVVHVEVVNGISISSTAETMAMGSTLQLYLTAPNPYEGDVIWKTSDSSIVTVDENGLVTAVGVGDANVTVRIKVGGVTKQARCKIKVMSAVDTIVLKSQKDYVVVGDNLTISAEVSPRLANTSLVWTCSDETIAATASTEDLSMTITGIQSGSVVIRAVNRDNSIVATKVIKVIDEINALSLSDTEVTLPCTAGYYQLYAYCEPALPENQKLTWSSSNTKIITVDENGKVILVKPGQAVITCVTENGLTAQCTFTVTQGVEGIAFDEKSITMYVGEKERLTYTIKPDNASNLTLKWEVLDSKIATVDQSGYVTAKNVGTTVISARSSDGTGIIAQCTVTVLRNAKTLKLDVSTLALNVGDAYQLDYSLTPADASDSVTFTSSDSKIAVVNSKGKITAKAVGKCTIVATPTGGAPAQYVNVEVLQQVTGLTLDKSEAIVYTGEEITLVGTVTPKNASDTELTWASSNAKTATVSKTGVVKGVSSGVVLISCTAMDGEYTATCLVTVYDHVTGVTLNKTDESIFIGDTLQLEEIIAPAGAYDKSVTWGVSNSKIASVDKNGLVKGVGVGTTLVTCQTNDGGYVAFCTITVKQHVKDMTLSESEATIHIGEELELEAIITPKTASDNSLTWSSSNAKIATVDEDGIVKGVAVGSALIMCRTNDGDCFSYCMVNVIEGVTGVEMVATELEIFVGEKKEIEVTITPATATNKQLIWKSNNDKIASVDSEGEVTGVTAGTTLIMCTTVDGEYTCYCIVTVKEGVMGVKLNYNEATIYVEQELELEAIFTPATASNQEVTWTTTNEAVASVNKKGVVTGVAGGVAIIKCVTQENGYIDYCIVTVLENVTDIKLQDTAAVGVGKKLKLEPEISSTASNKKLTWSSDDESICTVSDKGVLYGVREGTCMVTVTATDGSGVSAECEVTVFTATKTLEIDPDMTYIEMIVGEVQTVKYTINPSNASYAPVWESEDPSIAMVNQAGRITALKLGMTTINLTAGDNPEITAKVVVKVIDPVYASGITFNISETVMTAGETITVIPSFTPVNITESYTWSSDNPVVASVDGRGNITAKRVGCATITLMTKSGKTQTCNVYVVGMSEATVTLHQYEQLELPLEIDLGSSKANLDIRWGTSNQNIASVTATGAKATVTAKKTGTATVYVLVNGRKLTCTVKVIKNR